MRGLRRAGPWGEGFPFDVPAVADVELRLDEAGAQFVIATHSPVLLAVPGANVYELGPAGVVPTAYDDLDAVRVTRGFLDAPERYVRAALES